MSNIKLLVNMFDINVLYFVYDGFYTAGDSCS